MRKYCKALVNLGVAFIILTLIVFLVPKLLVFFAPFVAGWIIALIASPLVRFFEEKVKIKRKAGSAFVIVAVIALVILILYLVGAKLVDEIMGLIGALPDIWDSAENDFADIGQNLSVIYNRFPADVQQDCAVRSCWLVLRIAASVSLTAACARFSCVCAVDTASAAFCVLRFRASFCPESFRTSWEAAAYSCWAASIFALAAMVAESVSPSVFL